MRRILITLIIVGLFGIGFAAGVVHNFLGSSPSTNTDVIVYNLEQSTSFRKLAEDLEDKGLITDAVKFYYYGRIIRASGKLRVGEYALRASMTPDEILKVLISGKSIEYKFSVPEGSNLFEIAEEYERHGYGSAKEFLNTARDRELVVALIGEEADTLEGYLFPETYNITRRTGVRGIIKMMVKKFFEVYHEIEPLVVKSRMSRKQVLTLASIIEKETGVPEERTLISSVFHNRLKRNMRLETDPTVIYGMWMAGKDPKNIKREDLRTPSPYNTYTFVGLPHGPIANPGKEAMLAALKPASSEYIFFVSHNDGTHEFTVDYKEHLKAVQRYQRDPKAREGKSWRDLKNKNTGMSLNN